MIQDIAPHQFYNEYHPEKRIREEDHVFLMEGRNLVTKVTQGSLVLPQAKDLPKEEFPEDMIYLFSMDGQDYYLYSGQMQAPEGFEIRSLDELRNEQAAAKEMMFLSYTAVQLANWYKDNKFCGTCGTLTERDSIERCIVCPSCGRRIYPRIVPAVIVGVINGDQLLLTKYAGRHIGYYALVAGFTEIGETFEECVAREVMEEVGLKVKNIRYYKSQPWAMVDDLLAGFYCDVDGDPTIRLDHNELKMGAWFHRDEIELQPDDYSLTNEMMKMFKEGIIK